MEPLLSIIIPVYKVEKYLPQCLESIVRQVEEEKEEVEVLVIDDGSPDASGKLADACAKRHSFVRVIHRKNGGVAAARNTGLDQARGGWLYFVDSDDWIARGAVRTLLQKTGENPDADVILLDAWKNTGDREDAWEHFEQEFFWKDKAKIRSLQKGALYFPITGYRTKVPLAAPWDKVYRRNFLHQWGLRFRPELKVLDDMVFNVEVSAGRPGRRIAKKRFTITATCRNPLQTATGRTASARMKRYGNILAAIWKGSFGKKTGRRGRGRLSARHITAESSSPLAYAAGCAFFIRKIRPAWAKS